MSYLPASAISSDIAWDTFPFLYRGIELTSSGCGHYWTVTSGDVPLSGQPFCSLSRLLVLIDASLDGKPGFSLG